MLRGSSEFLVVRAKQQMNEERFSVKSLSQLGAAKLDRRVRYGPQAVSVYIELAIPKEKQ